MSSIARPDTTNIADAVPSVTDEAAAIAAAGELLGIGRIADVPAVLEPWLETAEFPDTYTLLARALVSAGRLNAAEDVLRRADTRFPEDPRVWKALAVLFRTLLKPQDELAYRRKLVYLQPAPPLAAYVRLAEASAAVLRKDPKAGQGDLRYIARKVASLPKSDGTDREERLALAQCLFQVPELQADAYAHYVAASPTPDDRRDLSVGWLRLHEWCEHVKTPVTRAVELGRPGYRPMLAELEQVAVLPAFQWMPVLDNSGVALSGFHMRRLVFHVSDSVSPLLMHRAPEQSVLRMPRDLPVLPGPALLLGGMAQYYHQTVEHLGTLAIAEALGVPADIPLVVNDDLGPFQLEQFALLGIEERRLVRVRPDSPVRFERLWVASRPVMGGRWVDPLMPAWYRKRLGLSSQAGRRKLYLSRGRTDRRRVINEPDVIAMLAEQGFELVQPELLSVRDQVALFAEASHIVAPTGAALTNMIFAPPGARVVAIYNRAFAAVDVDLYFDALAEACGHAFSKVLAAAVAAHQSGRTIDADIEVDLVQLRAALH